MKTGHALKPVLTDAPGESPVSLAEAKSHLRVTSSSEDDLIQGYLDAAVSHLDGWVGVLGRCMVTQTWRQDLRDFPASDILRLPFSDVSSVTITYTDANSDSQTLSGATYHLIEDVMGSAVHLADGQTWPVVDDIPNAVEVSMVCGFGAESAVPETLKSAIKLHIGSLYATRETSDQNYKPTMAYEALIAPYRRVGF